MVDESAWLQLRRKGEFFKRGGGTGLERKKQGVDGEKLQG